MAKQKPAKSEEPPVVSEALSPSEGPSLSEAPTTPASNPKDPVLGAPETLSSLADTVAAEAPNPNEDAITRSFEKQKERDAAGPGKGAGQAGKKRGPYKGDKSQVGTISKDAAKAETEKRCWTSGAETIDALVTMAGGFLGPEWYYMEPTKVKMPNNQEILYSEKERARQVFGNLYVYYGWEKPSPLMAVAFFSIGYAGARLRKPETRAKALGALDKIRLWLTKNKMERLRLKQEREAKEREDKNNPSGPNKPVSA